MLAGWADDESLATTARLAEIDVAVVVGDWITMRIKRSEFRSRHHISSSDRTTALTGPPPINIDFRNDAIGGSASNALLCQICLAEVVIFRPAPAAIEVLNVELNIAIGFERIEHTIRFCLQKDV